MASGDKLYCTDQFKILKHLKDLGNCEATEKLCSQPPNECYTFAETGILWEVDAIPSGPEFIFLNVSPPKGKGGLGRKGKHKEQRDHRPTTGSHWKASVSGTHDPVLWFFFMCRMTHPSCNTLCNEPFSLMSPSIQNKEYPPCKIHTYPPPTVLLI